MDRCWGWGAVELVASFTVASLTDSLVLAGPSFPPTLMNQLTTSQVYIITLYHIGEGGCWVSAVVLTVASLTNSLVLT